MAPANRTGSADLDLDCLRLATADPRWATTFLREPDLLAGRLVERVLRRAAFFGLACLADLRFAVLFFAAAFFVTALFLAAFFGVALRVADPFEPEGFAAPASPFVPAVRFVALREDGLRFVDFLDRAFWELVRFVWVLRLTRCSLGFRWLRSASNGRDPTALGALEAWSARAGAGSQRPLGRPRIMAGAAQHSRTHRLIREPYSASPRISDSRRDSCRPLAERHSSMYAR